MQDKFEWPEPEEEADETIIRNVREHGCHIVGIPGAGPAYAFSIGLFLNYGQAEVVIFGLDQGDSANVINDVRDRAAQGLKFVGGDICEDLLVDRKVSFVEVPLQLYDSYLGSAIWFYQRSPRPFRCLQIVWPDREGLFPWDAKCNADVKRCQPLLRSFS